MSQKVQYPKMDFVTQPGRLVTGDVANASDKGYNGAKREVPQFFFGLAVPKVPNPPRQDGQNPTNNMLGEIQNHTFQSYASMGQAGAGVIQRMQQFPIGSTMPGGATAPFAWKIDDGDAPDNVQKPGWAGCWIVKFTSIYAVTIVDANNQQMDPNTVKLGWWAEVAGNTLINGQTDHTAGIHFNPRFVRIVGYDQVITPGPSADQVFAAPPAALPPGVSATPVAPAQGMPQQPPAPMPGQYGQQPPAPQQQYGQQVGNYTPPPVPAPQPTTMPAQPTPQSGQPVYTPAPSQAVQAPPGPGQAAYAQPGSPATASPSNQPPAGVTPHPGFGGQQ